MQNGRDKAYEILRQRLVGGHYNPGAQLKEEPLARDLGLSRTPVRTALRRLVDDGLATDSAGQGIRVAEWSDWDVEETFQLRMLLEPYASFLAATRGGSALVERLEASNQAMAEGIAKGEDGIAEVQAANRDFHHALLEAAGSPRLRTILETMIDMPIIKRSFYIATPQELEQSLHHHRDLTLAVRAADGELARQVMQLHLRMSFHRFMRHRSEYRQDIGKGRPA
ncbi:GntR family transcriptional regulator [Variovorax saccharolyticus]|uniref:GntR family transcriptional regulator n=1 Tax=Variovorax saccharolyticus TaxID=3053516 RepID=UPI00257763CC|nr:GntR family transcriptional regulator [Variovorax sp. J31P216]MDM0025419.1 GntR family transcriptional regulator [Variovorax sp. J31P216]